MSACNKCFEDNWSKRSLGDGVIEISCQSCGNSFNVDRPVPITQEGEPCRHCQNPVVWKGPKLLTPKRLKHAFHFCKWFKCLKCKASYYVESYKKLKGQDCECPRLQEQKQERRQFLMDV